MYRASASVRAAASLAVVLEFALFSLAAESAAQTAQTANIVGRVVDDSGGVLPGVTVTTTSPALQVPSVTAVTDDRGEYRLTPLPIGEYAVEYTLGGFQTVRREGIHLTASFTARLNVTMKVGELEETVTVSGATPVVDTASTSITSHLTKEVLDIIPTGKNAYIGLMELAPGARTTNIDVGGNAISSTPRFNNFGMAEEAWPAIDGVVTKTNNISDSANFPDFNTAEEATVSTMGHDASIPNRGVAINMIVKSGSNDFHGSVQGTGTHSSLESEQEGGGGLQYRGDISGDIGGRIIRDKLWFYLGIRKQHQEIDVINCFKPDGSPCERMNNSKFFTPKLTYQITPSHRLSSFAWLNYRHDVAIEAPTEWSARRNWGGEPGAGKVEWQGLISPSFVTTVLGGLWHTPSWTRCVDETCDMIAGRDRNTGAVWGLTNRAPERGYEARWQLKANASWFKPTASTGTHELKFGFEHYNDPYRRRQLDRGVAKNYRLNWRGTTSDRIEIYNLPLLDPDNRGKYYGFYLADTWTIGRRLTLNLGVRYAHDVWREAAGCKEASPPPAHLAFPDTCWEETVMPTYEMVVPRLRAAYDLTGDGKTTIKGGWGRYARLRLFDDLQPLANNVISTAQYRWRDFDGNRDYDPGEVNLDPNGTDFISLNLTGTFASAGRGVVNPDEKQPYTDEYSVQFERELMPLLAVRVLGIYARVGNPRRLANAKRPYESFNIPINSLDPGPDGVVGNSDDGAIITWYDYPSPLAGVDNQQAIYVNDDAAFERYTSTEVAVTKRLSGNWQLQASYSLTKRDIGLTPNEDTFNTQDPNSEIFARDNNWEWLIRASGSYLFPYGILASARYEQRSGMPWARTALLGGGTQIPNIELRTEEIGSRRLPHINLVTVRGEKRFGLRNGQEIRFQVDLANLTNTDVPTDVTTLSGANFGLVAGRISPRVIVFGAHYQF